MQIEPTNQFQLTIVKQHRAQQQCYLNIDFYDVSFCLETKS